MENLKKKLLTDLKECEKRTEFIYYDKDNINETSDETRIARVNRKGKYDIEFCVTNRNDYPIKINCKGINSVGLQPTPFLRLDETYKIQLEENGVKHRLHKLIEEINKKNEDISSDEKLANIINLFVDTDNDEYINSKIKDDKKEIKDI